MNKSETIQELAAALAKAQGQMPIAKKSTKGYNNKYAPLPDLVRLAQPILDENGLSVVFDVVREQGEWMIEGTLTHSSGQWISVRLPYIISEENPQSVGTANTYARRYCYSNLIGIVSEEDAVNDPDNRDNTQGNNTQGYNTQDKPPINPNKRISEKQQDWINKILNYDPRLLSILLKSYNYSDVEQLTMGEFDEARKRAQKIRQMSQKSDAQEQSEIK